MYSCTYTRIKLLATARQGSCFIPILFPLAWLFGAYGVGAVQAVADVLSVALAVPIMRGMNRKIDAALEEMNR